MSDSDEERVMSVKRSYGPGEDIFENMYDTDELVENGTTVNSTEEDEEEDEEDDDEEEEGDIPKA